MFPVSEVKIKGDGQNDFAIGESTGNSQGADRIYVVFGDSNGLQPVLDLTTLNGVDGFEIVGEPNTRVPGLEAPSVVQAA